VTDDVPSTLMDCAVTEITDLDELPITCSRHGEQPVVKVQGPVAIWACFACVSDAAAAAASGAQMPPVEARGEIPQPMHCVSIGGHVRGDDDVA
jgi:hypothetical protein